MEFPDSSSIIIIALLLFSTVALVNNELAMRRANKRFEERMRKLGIDVDGNQPADTEEILSEKNQEVRSARIEKWNRRNLEEIDSDETGTLYETTAEPLRRVVKVKNSTPEANGRFKTYWLRVPLHIETAREGVAWTFGMDADEYNPSVES